MFTSPKKPLTGEDHTRCNQCSLTESGCDGTTGVDDSRIQSKRGIPSSTAQSLRHVCCETTGSSMGGTMQEAMGGPMRV